MAAARRRAQEAVAPPPAPVVQIQRRAKDPPTFEGKPQDDVVAWLEEYQDTADFNLWSPEESLRQVRWALTGFAKNWYRNLQPQPATFPQFSQVIRAAFKHPAYDSGVASQLRNRKQGIDESPVMYCFDKLNLCNRVDPRMTEGVKLDHLIRGMKPTLVEKVYPSIDFANPNTAAFVQLVQLHHQATWVANSNDWVPPETEKPVNQFLVTSPGTSAHSSPVTDGQSKFITQTQLTNQLENFEKQLTSKLEKDLRGELTKYKRELRDDFKEIQEKGFGELLEGVGKAVRTELKRNGVSNQQKRSFGGENSSGNRFNGGNFGKRRRTEDGRPICYQCNTPGHIAKNCGNQGGSHLQPLKPTIDSVPKN
jgi:hypothetical protein